MEKRSLAQSPPGARSSRRHGALLAGLMGMLALSGSLTRPLPLRAEEPKVVPERVRGQWRSPDSYRLRLTGKVTVIDANTLAFEDGTRIQAAGVTDAPDLEQQARINGTFYSCGKEAAAFLKELIGERPVSFYAFGNRLEKDEHNRLRGSCFVGETSLDRELVRNGWALAHHSGMTPYEIIARENKRGLWRGEFVLPEAWRAGKRLPGEPAESSPEGKALAALREFDAVVRVDQTRPDRPVVAVEFRPNAPKKAADADLALLEGFPHLRSVGFPSNPITDAGLAHLQKLSDLEEVNLNWTKVTAAGVLRLVKDRTSLRRLELSGVDLRDDDLAALKGLKELKKLNLRSTLITDNGVAHLQSLPKLEFLNISTSRGRITDAALEALKPLTELEDLDLDRTQITDAGLVHLKGMRNLRRLQFAHTAITDAGLENLQGLPNLSYLNSAATKVTQEGRDKLSKTLPLLDKKHPQVTRHYESGRLTKITGKVEVLDAHMLRFADGTEVELNGGMDAPDLEQKAKLGEAFYPCGKRAAEFLQALVGDQEVTYYDESQRGNRLHGDCFVGETCLQIEMVRNGWAVSHHTGMDSWQMIASENKRGLWRGTFVLPERWRLGERLPDEPLQPGYQVNDPLCPYFVETKVAGPDPGDAAHLVCAYEGRPVVLVYTWAINPSVVQLIQALDAAAAKHKEERLACYVVLFADSQDREKELKALAEKARVPHMLLTLVVVNRARLGDATAGPGLRQFLAQFDRSAETRVFLADGQKQVRASHPYRKGELKNEEIGRIVKDLPKILPQKKSDSAPSNEEPGRNPSGLDRARQVVLTELATIKADHAQAVSFSPDGALLAAGYGEPAVKVWDVRKGKEVFTGTFEDDEARWCRAVAFTPDGRLLAASNDGGTIKLWDAASHEHLATLRNKADDTAGLAFTPDGKTLFCGCRTGIQAWEVATRKERAFWKGHNKNLSSLALSKDGRMLASGSADATIKLWDVATGKELRTLTGHGNTVRAVAFSPDGKTLASGAWDNVVKLWDVYTGKERAALKGHSNQVMAVAFAPDGNLLATTGRDRLVKFWDPKTGAELSGFEAGGFSLAFSPDETKLATGAEHKPTKLWEVKARK
jgi:endonuclease YncB( thermonuclease family)